MRSKEQINELKQIPVTQYLSQQGIQPVKKQGDELIYYSPKNQEHTPSFLVNTKKNVFHDYSGIGESGDIIRLVQYLNGCSFTEAITILEQFDSSNPKASFFFSGQTTEPDSPNLKITSIQPVRNRSLLAYVSSRNISNDIASIYLNEIHYRIGDKNYYATGFRNDKGGFELRSQHFKGCTSPKWFTTIPTEGRKVVNLFEGVYDFLSCCQFFNSPKLTNPTIILNSLSFLKDVQPILEEYETVNAFLDNDKAGKQALQQLQKGESFIRDCSYLYPDSKDFNDHLKECQYT